MRIASITITSDRHLIIREALESVCTQVDKFLFVDLGIDPLTMEEIKVACGVCGTDTAFTTGKPDEKIDALRNRGLDLAAAQGFDWAIQLDTDERLSFPDNFREILGNSPGVNTFSSIYATGTYSKERVFRLPVDGVFTGGIHEQWSGSCVALMKGLTFFELPKSEETLDTLTAAMVKGLEEQMKAHPESYRWPLQLALIYRAKEKPGLAIKLLFDALNLDANETTKAWMQYVVALCYMDINDPVTALSECLDGLSFHPGLAELSHLAGICCMKMGRPQEAMCWANMAISNGLFYGSSFAENRMGHREPYALWDGPFELQRDAMKAMGYPEEMVTEADDLMLQARKRRHNG
jgi:tetratricopeptide (TPR) repeat protein